MGYGKANWERENLLVRNDYMDSIRNFWSPVDVRTEPYRKLRFYPDPKNKHRYTVCIMLQDLKAHKTREGHHKPGKLVHTRTTTADAILEKRKKMQT